MHSDQKKLSHLVRKPFIAVTDQVLIIMYGRKADQCKHFPVLFDWHPLVIKGFFD